MTKTMISTTMNKTVGIMVHLYSTLLVVLDLPYHNSPLNAPPDGRSADDSNTDRRGTTPSQKRRSNLLIEWTLHFIFPQVKSSGYHLRSLMVISFSIGYAT